MKSQRGLVVFGLLAALGCAAGCGAAEPSNSVGEEEIGESAEALRLGFSTERTGSATVNTANRTFQLGENDTIVAGTCGLLNASGEGDTFLRLFRLDQELTNNDDTCGLLSFASVVAPIEGDYEVRAGCSRAEECGGVVVFGGGSTWSSFEYHAAATNDAQNDTENRTIHLMEGELLTAGTCGLPKASGEGNTFLRIVLLGEEVAFNDDACEGLLSQLTYTVPAGTGGDYELRAGCYDDLACSGVVVY